MTEPPFDPRALRDAFGAFMTGVTVATSCDADGRPIGFTANSFASVSLSPPLLLVCIAKSSRSHAAVMGSRAFVVNILAEDQKDVSNTFASRIEDRFAALSWRPSPLGSPVLAGAAAWFDCELERTVDAGDHTILLGRIVAFEDAGRNGLGYSRGGYFTAALEAKGQIGAPGAPLRVAAVAERGGEVFLAPDGSGRLTLPSVMIDDANAADAIGRRLAEISGLSATVGFLYSVYSDRKTGFQNTVYRAVLGPGEPKSGRFFATNVIPFDMLDAQQTSNLLRRFARESDLGNFGVYVGNEVAGRVHPLRIEGQS